MEPICPIKEGGVATRDAEVADAYAIGSRGGRIGQCLQPPVETLCSESPATPTVYVGALGHSHEPVGLGRLLTLSRRVAPELLFPFPKSKPRNLMTALW